MITTQSLRVSRTLVLTSALKKLATLAIAAAAILSSASTLKAQGWATYNGSVTGGAGGPSVTVTTLSQLTTAIGDDVARVVNVSGTINLGSSSVRFGSNKTIQGVGTNSGFVGNLKAVGKTNIIIQRLNFTNPNTVGDGDGMTIEGCTRLIIDHCSFVDCGDGSLDIKRGADLVTVSWCKFNYTFDSGHNFVNLIGHSDSNGAQDRGKLRITFHHNWWGTGCVERMPRVRFGKIHSYNNYFNAPGNNYCIRASIESQVLTESNSFENIDSPQEKFDPAGLIRSRNNQYVNCTGVVEFADNVFVPPYAYSLESAANVKASVTAGAGAGGGGSTTPAPSAPSNLTASAISGSQINLAWSDNSSNEASFTVDRATNSTFSAGLVSSNVGANTTTFQASGLSANTTYYFRVRASNSGGSSANSATASATTTSGGGGAIVYQAESGVLGGGSVTETTNGGFNGTAYVNSSANGGTLTLNNVSGNGGGSKALAIRYALGATTARTCNLTINGSTRTITFQPTGAWTTWQVLTVTATLNNSTANTIVFTTTGTDAGNIDQITIP